MGLEKHVIAAADSTSTLLVEYCPACAPEELVVIGIYDSSRLADVDRLVAGSLDPCSACGNYSSPAADRCFGVYIDNYNLEQILGVCRVGEQTDIMSEFIEDPENLFFDFFDVNDVIARVWAGPNGNVLLVWWRPVFL